MTEDVEKVEVEEEQQDKWMPCPTCEEIFIKEKMPSRFFKPIRVTNAEALRSHYKDRPWEVVMELIQKNGQRWIKCKHCKREYLGLDAFAYHVEDYPECHNFALEQILFRLGKPKKKEFVVYDYRPGERDVITHSVKYDKYKRKKLYPHDGEIDYSPGTTIVTQEMKWGPKHRAATILGIAGIPGSGKSTLAITLGFHHRTIWVPYVDKIRPCRMDCLGVREENNGGYCGHCPYFDEDPKSEDRKCDGVKIAVKFNVHDSLGVLEFLSYGDLLIVDEMPLMVGEGSIGRIRQLKTILNILRKGSISWFFVNPLPQKYITTYNLVLEVVAQNTARDRSFDETIGVTYNRKVAPIGWFRIKVISNTNNLIFNQFLDRYEEDKDANIESMKESEGAQSGSLPLSELDKNVPKIYKFMCEYGFAYSDPTEMTKKDVTFIVRRHYSGSVQSLSDLADHFIFQVNQSPEEFDMLWRGSRSRQEGFKEIRIDSGDFQFVLTEGGRQIGSKDIYADVWKYIEEAERISPTKSAKYHHGHSEAWYLTYAEGMAMDDVGRELGNKYKKRPIRGAAIANKYKQGGWIAKFREEVMGTLFELYHEGLLNEKGIEWERRAGVGQTDIIHKTEDIGVEVKSRMRQFEVPEEQWGQEYLTQESRERVQRGGRQYLVLYKVEPQQIEISQYQVILKPKEEEPSLVDIEDEINDENDDE